MRLRRNYREKKEGGKGEEREARRDDEIEERQKGENGIKEKLEK
jgi:hypothetical protein